MIVFFHGFAATGQGSSKAAALRHFFRDRAEVVTPTYPCRRIATHYDKFAVNFVAAVALAAIVIWWA